MGLIFENVHDEEHLHGRYNITKLKGVDYVSVLNSQSGNTIMLLGEEHQKKYCPCRQEAGCSSIIVDFVDKLDYFAERNGYRVELHTEHNYSGPLYDRYVHEVYNYRTKKVISPKSIYFEPIEIVENDVSGVCKGNSSIMAEFGVKYSKCYTTSCNFNNIIWNAVDIRKNQKLSIYTTSKANSVYMDLITLFKWTKMEDVQFNYFDIDTEVKKPMSTQLLLEFERTMNNVLRKMYKFDCTLAMYLRKIVEILGDEKTFISDLLEIPLIKELYDKVDKTKFTKESFVELTMLWRKPDSFPSYFNHNVIYFLNRIIDFYEYANRDNVTEIDKIVTEIINLFDIQHDSAHYINYITLAPQEYTGCVLDIYFILSSATSQDKKLVVGYFGQNHSEYISKYYCNIIKTHTNKYENKCIVVDPDLGREVVFNRNINIKKLIECTSGSCGISGGTKRKKIKRKKTNKLRSFFY